MFLKFDIRQFDVDSLCTAAYQAFELCSVLMTMLLNFLYGKAFLSNTVATHLDVISS